MADGSEPTILALSPSAEALAYAVTEGALLLDYGVRRFEVDEEQRLVSEQAVATAEAALDHFAPDVMALRRIMPDGSYERSQRNLLSDRIRAVAVRRNLNTCRVTRAAACEAVNGDPEASRNQMIVTLAGTYPHLPAIAANGDPERDQQSADVLQAVGLAAAAARGAEAK